MEKDAGLQSKPISEGISYKRHKGLISYTYKDVGSYGQFINQARLDAYNYALDRHNVELNRIIDLGCSYGSWAENWNALGFKERIGIDFNETAIDKAKNVFEQASVGDTDTLKVQFSGANIIASNSMIIHVMETDVVSKIYNDVYSTLVSGGYFILAAVNSDYYMTPAMFEP